MNTLPGISGRLFPSRYLIDAFAAAFADTERDPRSDERQRRCVRWWAMCASQCGPTSGLRVLLDTVAMPLFGMLDYRASSVVIGRDQVRALLATPAGTPLVLVVLPWSARAATRWRDAAEAARPVGARWAFVLAPPFLSLVAVRGFATRRSVEFVLPDALSPPSFSRFWALTKARTFDAVRDSAGDRAAPIEQAMRDAAGYQSRVRDDLQHGVAAALDELTPALTRPARTPAPRQDKAGVTARDEALTLVYRILFLLFAESRDLAPHDDPTYRDAYAISTLCREALRERPSFGLWQSLAAASRLSRAGYRGRSLVVNAFNGHLFARASAPTLERGAARPRSRASVARELALTGALVSLGTRPGPAGREQISYRDLGVEQLGAVYERVLDLDSPASCRSRAGARTRRSTAKARGAHSLTRKQSGTFYTPQPLAEFVVRRTLAPLVAGLSADDILSLRILDPAMGSGAFLVAACRFLAAAHARALIEEGRASASDLGETERASIRRQVAERCLVGVDRNPVAVQLARLSLWLATLAADKPLTFLDHRLRVGDSLIGATPDDVRRLTSRRRHGNEPSLPLFDTDVLRHAVREHAGPLGRLLSTHDDSVAAVRDKEALWHGLRGERAPLTPWRLAASLWCARWFWPVGHGHPPGPAELRALLDSVLRRDRTLRDEHVTGRLDAVRELEAELAFFHWPLEFPDVFYESDGDPKARPGFDAVLGNPPWEMVRHDGGERAATRPPLGRQLIQFIRGSGLYPACDQGHVNLYQPFLERSLGLVRPGGRIGLILPWGLASDTGTANLRERLLHTTAVDTLVGLDNAAALFPIHRGMRFVVATATAGSATRELRARFGVKYAEELDELPGQLDEAPQAFDVRMTTRALTAVGGGALRIPDVRSSADLTLLETLMTRFAPLGQPPWAARFSRELNATESRRAFGTDGLPVLEGKHLTPFRVRCDTTTRIAPSEALRRLRDARFDQPRLAYRDVAAVGNRLSFIAAVVPAGVVTTHTVFCLRTPLPLEQQHFLCACFNSYVLNYAVRLLMGGHLTTSLVEDLPVPVWNGSASDRRIAGLSEQLSRQPGDEAQRERLALLQGLVAARYGLDEAAFAHVLGRFPLVPAAERRAAAERLQG